DQESCGLRRLLEHETTACSTTGIETGARRTLQRLGAENEQRRRSIRCRWDQALVLRAGAFLATPRWAQRRPSRQSNARKRAPWVARPLRQICSSTNGSN